MEELFSRIGVNVNFAFVLLFGSLIWARVLAMISMLPFLFAQPTPKTVRVGASLALTLFAYPLLAPKVPPVFAFNMLEIFALFLKEVLMGMAIGLVASFFFYGFQSAGSLIDGQRGTSLARVLIPELGEQSSTTGQFLFLFAVVLYLSLGGHLLFFEAFFTSFQVLPVLQFPPANWEAMPLLDMFAKLSGDILFIATQISVPILIAIFLIDIILGVANRFAPQINVWELGFNLRGYVGILLLFLTITLIAHQVEHYTNKSNSEVQQVIQLFNPPPAPVEEPVAPEPPPAKVIP